MPDQSFTGAVFSSAWKRSRDAFDWKHSLGAAAVTAGLRTAQVGPAVAFDELWKLALTAGLGAAAWALLLFLWNLVHAPSREYGARVREARAARAEVARLRESDLVAQFAPNQQNVVRGEARDVFIRVWNSGGKTVPDVSVRLERIVDVTSGIDVRSDLRGLPMRVRDGKDGVWDEPPAPVHDLHPDDRLEYFVLTTWTKPNANIEFPHCVFERRQWSGPRPDYFAPSVETRGYIPNGKYRVTYRIQGRDTPQRLVVVETGEPGTGDVTVKLDRTD